MQYVSTPNIHMCQQCSSNSSRFEVCYSAAQSARAAAAATYIVPDKVAPEPVASPQHLHLLQRHSLGLRQEEDGVQGHHSGPESKEEVGSPFHPADQHTMTGRNM